MISSRLIQMVPSAISCLRIGIALVFPWLPTEYRLVAVVFAAFTDLIDGPISRWLKVDGTIGQVIDPIADKIFFGSVLATVLVEGSLAWWEVLLAAVRDVGVLVSCVVLFYWNAGSTWARLQARVPGKATTVLQIAFVLAVVSELPTLAGILLIPTCLVGIVALVDYCIAFRKSSMNAARVD